MTGAVAATVSAGWNGPGVAGANPAPSTLSWNDIYGEDSGATQALTLSGITTPIQLTASRTGSAVLSYILNGAYAPYTGAFTVAPGDVLAWALSISGSIDRSGVISVSQGGGATLDTFSYLIYSSHGVRQ